MDTYKYLFLNFTINKKKMLKHLFYVILFFTSLNRFIFDNFILR